MAKYLTLEEAKQHTLKSESTLRRLVRTCLKDAKLKKNIKTKKLANGGYQYLINSALLDEKYQKIDKKTSAVGATSTPKKSIKKPSKKTVETPKKQDNQTIEVLQQYIQTLKSQLEVKDAQIAAKNNQVSELLERDRESNLLLERINQALIKYKIPEYIETQVVEVEQIPEKSPIIEVKKEPEHSKPAKKKKKKKNKKGKATFSDWLNQF